LVGAWHWRSIGEIDPLRLREARLTAHHAVQWLARLARGYVAPRPHDRHTNLGWDDDLGGFTTHPLSGGAGAGLQLAELTLMLWPEPGRAGVALRLDGLREPEIREWLGERLSALRLDPGRLDAPAPYQIPAHRIGRGEPYAAAGLPLPELAVWYANANLVLSKTWQRVMARGLDAPPVRCWPHHFDLDSLVPLGQERTMGAGFCPGDEHYDEPYFYVSAHPAPDVAGLPSLPLAGHWHTRNFTAAITLARNIVVAGDQQADCEAFLNAATDILIKV
jgi:hypothetical protein